jgi:hypothetical protein
MAMSNGFIQVDATIVIVPSGLIFVTFLPASFAVYTFHELSLMMAYGVTFQSISG